MNPISGKLSKKKKIRVIENIDPSTKPEIIFSQSLEDAGKKAQEFMLKKYLVVACGGDGFINTFRLEEAMTLLDLLISTHWKRLLMQ